MKISKLKIMIASDILVDIAFEIESSLALVGQSGSGKSLTLKALLGMLPHDMSLELECSCDFELIAGNSVAFIPQNPFTALSPLTKINKQFFVEKSRVKELFDSVGLSHELLSRFPPELSGGQLQRVVIAMALSNKPQLLLLDEPTTALDPETRVVIINLLRELQAKEGFKMLFVTHDISSAKNLCQYICVIKEGKMVESGVMDAVINRPQAEYTKTLIEANFANREFRV
ncbi:ABC transporter ATP-binding protein [Sulfurimonas sp. SAG-AH-194-L11]|nr:ATP-binding cassette domain-containing protein [Sulfurimonas sp. SAG-AH-194-L11]MDF1877060.1 ABC transporter ATP-binding protein [Sulfurimonas sp. SAG-AH-194-L11]